MFKSDLGHSVNEGNDSKSDSTEPANIVVEKTADKYPSVVDDRGNDGSVEQNQVNDASIAGSATNPELNEALDLNKQEQLVITGNV